MEWFNEVFDLAAVASGAGLAGGSGAAIVAWTIRGAIMRFIVRTLVTALITGIGFYFLLGALGFQIVPEEETAAPRPGGMAAMDESSDTFLPQGASPQLDGAPAEETDDGKKTIIVKSPFRRDG
ncbi:hypothetical protein [Henriciella aquimarina]|uniref:hypothetical protein n=1 Tax=Henriciella aquimarina TaxID=545261 RepID=UPI000A00E35C|nr:hypothetical protein [Henriciella aquimarina]